MALKRIKKGSDLEQVMGLMDPVIQKWFRGKFKDLTEPQSYAIPLIHNGVNVLVSSPTGSGKTITAFLSIINELFQLHKEGKLEDRIYCVYISPLKALANDINKNLREPLAEISQLAREEGFEPPDIRVAVRSGDTTNYERQKMARLPPHIFITTPESISLVLSTPKFSKNFRHVKYAVVDEIHEISSSKRGVYLSLNLERLQNVVEDEFTRIGLSATQAPIEDIAKFLVGYNNGRLRDCSIVQATMTKDLDLGIMCPVDDMTVLPYEVVNHKMYDRLHEEINNHRTTLVFTNTRSGTESMVFRLKEKGLENIAAHHGSLSRETRLEVEEDLRNGKLKSVVTSTSLELGIDIGHIDLVCQIGSPKSVAKGLQRIGRSGHGVYETARGRFIVIEKNDLVESAVLVRSAKDGRIDRISILKNSLDVLAQALVGMSLEDKWAIEDAYKLVKRSYCFKDLSREAFDSVIDYLAGKFRTHEGGYSRIWKDENEDLFGSKRGTRMIYYLNLGTIPEEANYRVLSNKGPLGKLSEKFVEKLSRGDIFVLGGKTYEFDKSRGMSIFVKDAQGRRPTVPSWTGEMLPRSFDLSVDIGKFRGRVENLIKKEKKEGEVEAVLMRDYFLDDGSAKSIYSYFKEHMAVAPVPTDKRLLIEGYLDTQERYNIIFHFCYGRRTNEALARAYALAISQKEGINVSISLTDDNFMLTVPKAIKLQGLEKMVTPKNLEELLRGAITDTEMFKQRFRHCAMRAFTILRNFKGKDIPVSRQLRHATRLLNSIGTKSDGFPVIEETFNEILHDAMDMDNARAVVSSISNGKIKVKHIGYTDVPSSFAHNIVLIGASDMILMEDRSGLLRELHKQVLSKIIADMPESTMDPALVEEYYRSKVPTIETKDDIVPLIKVMGPMNVLQDKGDCIYRYSSLDFETLHRWASEIIVEGELSSIYRTGVRWVPTEDVDLYELLYARPHKLKPADKALLKGLQKVDPEKKLSAQVKALEQAFLIERTIDEDGKMTFIPRRESANIGTSGSATQSKVTWATPKNLDEALRIVLRNTLEFRMPMSIEEVAVKLNLDEGLVETAIQELGPEISTIQLEGTTRYLLSRDKVRLQDRKKMVFGEREVRQFVINKHFHSCKDIDDYLTHFYEANMTLDIFNRVEDFDIEAWWKAREDGTILEGRFVKNRVGFMKREQAELMDNVTTRPNLGITDLRVLKAIQGAPGAGLWDLVRHFEDRYPKVVVKEALDKLDHGLYVVRVQKEHREWPTRNRYEAFGPGTLQILLPKEDPKKKKKRRGRPPKKKVEEKKAPEAGLIQPEMPLETDAPPEDPFTPLVMRCIELYGPAQVPLIRYHTGLGYEIIHAVIDRLETEGRIIRVSVVDGSTVEMFLTPKDLEALKAMPRSAKFKDRLRVLSQYDPYIRRHWLEVANRFGEGWFFPAVKDGKICGMVEMWNLSGCIEVREVVLHDEKYLPDLLKELDRHLDYHKSFGTEVLRVKKALGQTPDEMSKKVRKVFEDNGYLEIQGMLVKGRVEERTFPKDQVLAYIFHRQHLSEDNKYRDTLAAIQGMGGLHTEFEIEARVRIFHPLRKYKERLVSCLAIPEYLTHCTENDMLLYKAAKNRTLDTQMERALSIIRDSGALSRRELQKRLGLDQETFNKTVKDLYTSLYILRDQRNMFAPTEEPEVDPEQARRRIMRRIIENFGIISAEKIAAYTKHEFKMSEIRQLLKEWEDGGWLVKGYLVEGDETLYWMVTEDMDKVDGMEVKGERVLTTTDPVAQYLSQEVKERFNIGTCYLVLEGTEIVGAFKATKRSGTLAYTEFIGDKKALGIVQRFGRRWGLKVTERKDEKVEDDWDLMLWYEKRKVPEE